MTPLNAVSQSSSRLLVGQIGFEPMTFRVSDEISTTELLPIIDGKWIFTCAAPRYRTTISVSLLW